MAPRPLGALEKLFDPLDEITQHWALSGFTAVMLMFVLPLVALTMLLLAYQGWRKR